MSGTALPVSTAATRYSHESNAGQQRQTGACARLRGHAAVGSFVVQLAHRQGAYVITTVSARDRDFVRQLGANEVIVIVNKPMATSGTLERSPVTE